MNPDQLLARFWRRYWARVERTDSCWLWGGAITEAGYGSTSLQGRTLRAHRVTFEAARGPVPDGLVLDHLCRVRHCVNPDHLEAVTNAENVRRGERATKTVCIHGHDYTPENTYTTPDGRRQCRECQRGWNRAYRSRKGAAA